MFPKSLLISGAKNEPSGHGEVLLLKWQKDQQMWKHFPVHCQILRGAKVQLFQGRKVKHTVIYRFFAITPVQNTCFCSVFNALASKNPAKSCYVQCFFHFWPFFHCRKATKMIQNSISIPSCAQTPKNLRKMSKTPPYSGLGAKPFLGPPQLKLI